MSLPTFPLEDIRKRKVLTEKHQEHNRAWMVNWIATQKNKVVRKQNYEEAGRWREFEKLFYDVKQYPYDEKIFDNIFFELYERFE